ncbi:TonB-dependent receptor [Compostibacter hankyongensis]|uniref:TonB-dependent receptor n=1 Tax=Compostibacter hankyongensis TaxID=1007089 RepID=A0ABP8G832_9BACT
MTLKTIALAMGICYARFACGQCIHTFALSGKVSDPDGRPIAGAVVGIAALGKGTVADQQGVYHMTGLCPGNYTVTCEKVGFRKVSVRLTLDSNSRHVWVLTTDTTELKEVLIAGDRRRMLSTVTREVLESSLKFGSRAQPLGESLKAIPGLNSVQMGPSLSKPVIQGLYGNRILILNNGVRQEGQQWGEDHAPELDPFVAGKISVIKGAAGIRYGPDAIAGVVLLEPAALPATPGIGGSVNLTGASNGRMGVGSATLEGALGHRLSGWAWRVQGTLKRAGNFRTPHYYLGNTGLGESDFSASVGYRKNRFDIQLFYSHYGTKIGIFDGSHVGNIEDLYAAFKRSRPLTPSVFSYKIRRSYQSVRHDLFKASAHYQFGNGGKVEADFARQGDLRQEYDVDLPYSDDPAVLNMPQLRFRLTTHTLNVAYIEPERNHFSGSIGLSGMTQGNVFRGIRYLIPNFRNYTGGAFAIEQYNRNRLTLEGGLRYDYLWLRVYQRDQASLALYHSTFDYSNLTGTLGFRYRLGERFSINGNFGIAWRAPSINELYIRGVHFSAASYEIGDSALVSERSYNTTAGLKYRSEKFQAGLDLYDNEINHFIYAQPLLQPVTIISGTYPAFRYTQADVRLRGADLNASYRFLPHFDLASKISFVRGYNKSIHDDLIYMPADRFDHTLSYRRKKLGRLQDVRLSLQNVTVSRQTRVPPNSDYVPPPPGYSLFNADVGFRLPYRKQGVDMDFAVRNLTNVAYREYLNGFRYYADEPGINFIVSARLKF